MTALHNLSLTELARRIARHEVSSVEVTSAYLERIQRFDDTLRAFITVDAEGALAAARAADAAAETGGALHGVPVAIKDNIATAGLRTTGGSRVLKDWVPAEDAPVVRDLRRSGAVILGKTNLHEFAYGGTCTNVEFGAVRNPWNTQHVPGGSSGGSGVAVAAGMCAAALGTDTAGSIRLPACQCGVVGLKPTYGRVSIDGVIPLAWSLDHVGPLTRTVADAARGLPDFVSECRETSSSRACNPTWPPPSSAPCKLYVTWARSWLTSPGQAWSSATRLPGPSSWPRRAHITALGFAPGQKHTPNKRATISCSGNSYPRRTTSRHSGRGVCFSARWRM
jgi:Asp-tRNA(Asn)/Glu-tRNA(Gln) amidotransferase A subunit family amidase